MARTRRVTYAEAAGLPLHARILVVDDQDSVHEMLQPFLAGLDVVRVNNARQALEVCARSSPDIIVLDAVLPESAGYQFIPDLMASGSEIIIHAEVPKIDVAKQAYALGVRHMLPKSTEVAMLLPAVISWILETREGRAPRPDQPEVASIMASYFLSRQLARIVAYVSTCHSLSKRESQVLALALVGCAQKRMADWLEDVCEETVRKHARSLRIRTCPASNLKDLTAAIHSCVVPERPATTRAHT